MWLRPVDKVLPIPVNIVSFLLMTEYENAPANDHVCVIAHLKAHHSSSNQGDEYILALNFTNRSSTRTVTTVTMEPPTITTTPGVTTPG